MQTICIVVPCYNEENRLPANDFVTYFKNNESVSVCFVNDGSSDNTLSLLKHIQQQIGNNCTVVDLPQNSGKAEAVRLGVIENINKGFDYIGFFDADLATPLSEISYFISFCNGSLTKDIIIGSRFKRLGANVNRKPARHYIGRVFSTLASMVLKLPVYDTQCGAKLFSNSIASQIFNKPFISKWLFDIELFSRAIILYGRQAIKETVVEIPLNEWEDKAGSKIKTTYFIKAPLDLLRIRNHYKYQLK